MRYTRQITKAIIYLHARGLVHRDLKPENVPPRARRTKASRTGRDAMPGSRVGTGDSGWSEGS